MTRYIINTKHLLLMCLILFAFSPCIVKEAVFGSANMEYAKPLNKSKTTTQTNSCQYPQNGNQQIAIGKLTKINKQIEPVDFATNQRFVACSTRTYGRYSKFFSGNSPPKYILYKRLKLDIV